MIALLLFMLSRFSLGSRPTETRPPHIASIPFVDDTGRTRSVEEWRGNPAIVVPMYTRCPLACPLIAENLRRATLNLDPASYRVIFFSFDPRDTPRDLHAFRDRHQLPLAWTMAVANRADALRFFDSIGFRSSETMSHTSEVVILTPDLDIAKIAYGTNIDASTIESGLAVARGGRDWLGTFGDVALAGALLLAILASIHLVTLLSALRKRTIDVPRER